MTSMIMPAVVLMLITVLVWINLFIKRLSAIKAKNIQQHEMVTPEKLNALMDDKTNAPANCFKNLFVCYLRIYHYHGLGRFILWQSCVGLCCA